MARIPIKLDKIKRSVSVYNSESKKEITQYLVSVTEKGQRWDKTIICNYDDLERLRDEITNLLEATTTAEKLYITNEKADVLDNHYSKDELCKSCEFKLTSSCITCIFELQSPLERKLFLALKREYIKFIPQYPINWKGELISIAGKSYGDPINNFKDVLTVVDFYIHSSTIKLCVYTDGHTYHERTEEQAQRDKRIDRKLQELGFKVLRYTGKDINENINAVVSEIKKWREKSFC